MEDDVVDLMQVVKAAAQAQPQPMDEAA
jgi:hypothetical protein